MALSSITANKHNLTNCFLGFVYRKCQHIYVIFEEKLATWKVRDVKFELLSVACIRRRNVRYTTNFLSIRIIFSEKQMFHFSPLQNEASAKENERFQKH